MATYIDGSVGLLYISMNVTVPVATGVSTVAVFLNMVRRPSYLPGTVYLTAVYLIYLVLIWTDSTLLNSKFATTQVRVRL
jgi:hypothetical protein